MAEARKTILLVEDQALIALDTKRRLERRGYSVVLSYSGEDAVKLAASDPSIDLILMDIDLGEGIDGTVAARMILEGRELPVVFLSSHTESDIVELSEKITSYGYVVKDTGITVLEASIRMAFRLFEAYRETRKISLALHEKNQLLENVMKSFPGSVFWKDRNLVYLGCNAAEARAAGLSHPDEIVGKTDFDLGWNEGEPEFFRASDMKVLESGQGLRDIEEVHQDGDGLTTWMETSKAPIFDEKGNISGILGVSVDVTERVLATLALRESEARLSHAEEVAKIGNWKLMLDTGRIEGSKGACAIYGVDRDSMSLEEIQAMVLPEYREAGDRALSDLIAHDAPYDLVARIRRRSDGRIVEIRSIANFDRQANVINGVVMDTSEGSLPGRGDRN